MNNISKSKEEGKIKKEKGRVLLSRPIVKLIQLSHHPQNFSIFQLISFFHH